MQTIIIHGRQPGLGRAELESLYGPEVSRPAGNIATLIDKNPSEINFMRLGGMVKFAKILTVLDTTDWREIEVFLLEATPQHFSTLPEGKLKIGLSAYDIKTSPKSLHITALKLKKAAKATGRSVRIISNKELALNSATVLYNKLTQKLGWEIIFVRDGNQTIVAQSIAVQDINSYARRDQERPYRDARVGMLPPKLAQIIINLAVGRISRSKAVDSTILDPFCGTGVVLQEAILMGYQAYGTDLEQRMVDYSEGNLKWLTGLHGLPPACPDGLPMTESNSRPATYKLEIADATSHTWEPKPGYIAGETYLGRALSSLPQRQTLQKIISDVNTIHLKFLKNVASQTEPGFRLCLAVPVWAALANSKAKGFIRLPTLDKLNDLGYNRIKFAHASQDELIYHRPGQIVGRELVVLERK
ncbi:hypothetical protein KY385_01785 [Candidatus Parcubacteria bacterium]|nr:hypothetical protein [Candidatus Parcubacteria bacterium]